MSNLEKQMQRHITKYLQDHHKYTLIETDDITDKKYYFIDEQIIAFIKDTQVEKFIKLEELYGKDAADQILKAIKKELEYKPLWLIMREGIQVHSDVSKFELYYPKPRSWNSSDSQANYEKNKISFKEEYAVSQENFNISGRIDHVLHLNGFPIITIELKHRQTQHVSHAVEQYVERDHSDLIFKLPFAHFAVDDSQIMVATDPSKEENFLWFNTGLENHAKTKGEYPIEYFYADVLSKDRILDLISFYLVYSPPKTKEITNMDTGEKKQIDVPARSIFPRYHQLRTVSNMSDDILGHFSTTYELNKKYLVHHSAGSGKTLTISWLTDRLHSLHVKAPDGTAIKVFNMIVILTDRKFLDRNISDELENFSNLSNVIKYTMKGAPNRKSLSDCLKDKERIIIATQQKFAHIIEGVKNDEQLKKMNIAFLIDEAHRSQEGKMAISVRSTFTDKEKPDEDENEEDFQEEMTENIKKANLKNMLFVAFTATPSSATVQLFSDPFDLYTESEAIQEGYIVDVASNIISYETLYNLHSPLVKSIDEKLYPKGVISKALKSLAFQDEGLIQYKAEVMLRIFQDEVAPLLDGKSKAMIVTSSRISGLFYYEILKEKIKEKKLPYKIVYAFSDFVHPKTNQAVRERELNNIPEGQEIEDVFAAEDHRLMVVANKFQEGFSETRLCGMFLDKVVIDKNAVQTLSRLNRQHVGKDKVIVVDFTNNHKKIHQAFNKYRKGTPYQPTDPDFDKLLHLYDEIIQTKLFTQEDAERLVSELKKSKTSDSGGDFSSLISECRKRFNAHFSGWPERKAFVYQLMRFNKTYEFLSSFFQFELKYENFNTFASLLSKPSALLEHGTASELMKEIKKVQLIKAGVRFVGEHTLKPETVKPRPSGSGLGLKGGPAKASISEMIDDIKNKYSISNEEAIFIREICEEKSKDPEVIETVKTHKEDTKYLEDFFTPKLIKGIKQSYIDRNLLNCLLDPKYSDKGAIIDIMAFTVIQQGLRLR